MSLRSQPGQTARPRKSIGHPYGRPENVRRTQRVPWKCKRFSGTAKHTKTPCRTSAPAVVDAYFAMVSLREQIAKDGCLWYVGASAPSALVIRACKSRANQRTV